MSNQERVFITGLGALSASGLTADEMWAAVMGGQSSLGVLTQHDLSSWSQQLGGELKNIQLASLLPDRKLLKVISRQDVFGIYAAIQAIENSQLLTYRNTLTSTDAFNEDTAVYVGSPGNKYFQQYDFLPLVAKTAGNMQAFAEQLFSEVHPMWLLRILPNNVLAYTGITYGFKGVNQNITNHAVSGTQALIEAYQAIKQGQASRAVVVAYDIAIEPQGLYYYEKLGVLSANHLRPFDKTHDGTILAEGAAALVLESESSVKARSARCYGEVLGGMATTEAAGLFSIEEAGESLAALLTALLNQQHFSPEEISMVVAHGNGNPKSDRSEAYALSQVFQDSIPPITAFKWAMGHTICASGLIDAVLATYAMRESCVPGIATLQQLAPACGKLNAQTNHRSLSPRQKHYTMVINRGFASMNAGILLASCHE